MRCTTYCTAASYDLAKLSPLMQKGGSVQLYRDVLHAQLKEEKRTKGDIFFFSFGATVFWGFSESEEEDLLGQLKEFEKRSIARPERDDFTFTYGQTMKIEEDEIALHNRNSLTKLAISHGLAQSVKLVIFEDSMQKTIAHTQYIPTQLIKKGKIPLSRKEISKKMGEIFAERSFISLHTEILDTPELFWDHPELEPLYKRTIHYLDLSKRTELLNRRLSVIYELFEILSNELNHQHSSRLEWIIIILIVMEVVIAMLRDLFHII
jgi:uncharacterized Rmd1/YagE family protein